MELPAGITLLNIMEWKNRHENFIVQLKENASFNMRLPFPFDQQEKNYHATTKNFQWLIGYAIEKGISLRAIGSGWSFTEVAVCDGGIVDTRELRAFFSIADSELSPVFLSKGNLSKDLIFTQCGMSMFQLSRELEVENGWNQSLKASGATNGQTLAGATSTGTHGAAFEVGAVHDTILGLHIVTGPDTHIWLERASNPVASASFINWLGATLVSDDDIFNAAVVSFGSFGFIHGILLETEQKYLLKKYTTGMLPYNEGIKRAINALDFTEVKKLFPPQSGSHRLYHFEVIVNPHLFAENENGKGVYIKAMYKIPYREDYQKPEIETPSFEYGDDLLGVLQTVLDHAGSVFSDLVIPKLVTQLLPLIYTSDQSAEGTIGEMFANTKIRGKAASAAIGIACEHAGLAIEEIVKANKETPFAGALGLRFVKGTQALLGFTKFPVTCVLEMDGVDSAGNREFFLKIWDRFEEIGLAYTLHWGKINFNLNPERVRNMYGDRVVSLWKQSRKAVLAAEARRVFSNLFIRKCGLDD